MAATEETPVNPYSLLEAVNAGSSHSQAFTYYFLTLMGFYFVSIVPMSHSDLIGNTFISLPNGVAKISTTTFFTFSPIFLVFSHLIVLMTHYDLSRRLKEFDKAVSELEPGAGRTHPLRLEMNSYFYAQSMAGATANPVFDMFLRGVVWAVLILLPIGLLCAFQIKFLPYHDASITWLHRGLFLIDVFVVVSLGIAAVTRLSTETKAGPLAAMRRTAQGVLGGLLLAAPFLIFTIPGERLDRWMSNVASWEIKTSSEAASPRSAFFLTAFFFEGEIDEVTGNISSPFARNMIAIDADFTADALKETGRRGTNLRGRDFSFARFDRADLRKVDFTGANLAGALFRGRETQLKAAVFRGAHLKGTIFDSVLLDDVDFAEADITATIFKNVEFRGKVLNGHAAISDLR
ncbi:MAG: pentapeptide repeat-containing protein [Hyphomicrobium sp.]